MSTRVDVTVVTPTLNAERYLEACIASVAAQRTGGLGVQHIIVDGGSTDRTLELARHHTGVVVLEHNGARQSQAINAGLRAAAGDVVAWLGADDSYISDALAFVNDRFDDNASMDVLVGDCEVIGPDGKTLWWERPGPYDFRRLLRRGNYIGQPAVFLRRRVFERVGYLDESLDFAMDYELWLRMRGLHVEYVPRELARFRWHASSKSASSQLAGWREYVRIVRKHGGGWTPEMVWAYARLLVTLARMRVGALITGSTQLRPLTRGL